MAKQKQNPQTDSADPRSPAIGDRVLYVLPAASPHANEQREAVIVGILDDGAPALCVRAVPGDFLYSHGGTFEIVDDGAGYDAGGKPGTWRYATEQPKAGE